MNRIYIGWLLGRSSPWVRLVVRVVVGFVELDLVVGLVLVFGSLLLFVEGSVVALGVLD